MKISYQDKLTILLSLISHVAYYGLPGFMPDFGLYLDSICGISFASMSTFPFPRPQIPFRLAAEFNKDYNEAIKAFKPDEQAELTVHLIGILKSLGKYFTLNDKQYLEEWAELEDQFLSKYKKRAVPYIRAQFNKYFQPDIALVEKNIVTRQQFNAMTSAEQTVTTDEMLSFIGIATNNLNNAKRYLHLQDESTDTQATLPLSDTVNVTVDKDFTQSQQLLTIYYLLKAFGIEKRGKIPVTAIARFVHLLTGTNLTTMQNSDIYKKFLKMPNHVDDPTLMRDLNFIRPFFQELGLESAVTLIDEELRLAKKENTQRFKKR